MIMRRGCGCGLPGCGTLLIIAIVIIGLGWFVGVPRVVDTLQEKVAEPLSTVIAEEIQARNPLERLRQGDDVEFSFATINRLLRDENDDGELVISTDGNQITVRTRTSGVSMEASLVPTVSADGHLQIATPEDMNWGGKQVLRILAGGFEQAINTWLDQSGLRLTGIELTGDAMILSVIGR